jgi:hypothetical protein
MPRRPLPFARRRLLLAAAGLALTACSALPPTAIVLPLVPGWHEGEPVFYVSTEASDAAAAQAMGVTHAPRLRDALPAPGRSGPSRSALERIYGFPNREQASVLPSAPQPLGPGSRDDTYSPLWRVVEVRWQPGRAIATLRSEEQVLAAAERGDVALTTTDLVVNCPVVHREGSTMPGARLLR